MLAEGGVWGRIVIASAFFIQVIVFGTSHSIGVYNIEFLKEFDSGTTAISLVGSINFGMFYGSGPVCGLLLTKMSHRQVALIGATLSNIGLIGMPFATNLPYMYVFYGVLTGLGYSLIYIPSLILSGLYYSNHKSLSTGLATAGLGLGSATFPTIIYNLIQYYGWRGSLFILAGLNFHLFMFVALLRPITMPFIEDFAIENKDIAKAEAIGSQSTYTSRTRHNQDNSKHGLVIESNKATLNKLPHKRFIKVENITELPKYDSMNTNIVKHIYGIQVNHKPNKVNEKQGVNLNTTANNENVNGIISSLEGNVQPVDGDIINVCNAQEDYFGPAMFSQTTETSNPRTGIKLDKLHQLMLHLRTVFTFDFSMFWLSNICLTAGAGTLMIFLPKYMTSVGTAEESASLSFSMYGLGKCIGCVVCVVLDNSKLCNRYVLYISCALGAGIFNLLLSVPYFHTIPGFVILIFLIGLLVGVIIGLLVVITNDFLGPESLGYGYGYLMLANGVGVFCGPPLAGALIDSTSSGRLDSAIYVSGCCWLLAGLVMSMIPLARICINRDNDGKTKITSPPNDKLQCGHVVGR